MCEFFQDNTPNRSKLSPQEIKDVFIGYAHNKKGYQIYISEHKQYIISADATFYEGSKYFSSIVESEPSHLVPPTSSTNASMPSQSKPSKSVMISLALLASNLTLPPLIPSPTRSVSPLPLPLPSLEVLVSLDKSNSPKAPYASLTT